MARRIKILAPVAIAAILFGAYSLYWWIVAGKLDQGIDAWAVTQRQAGLTLEFERTPVTGFPFAFHATFRQPHIAGTINGQSFDWRGPDIEAFVSPFYLKLLSLTGRGRHTIDLGQGPATLDADAMTVGLTLDGRGALSGLVGSFDKAQLTLPDHRIFAASSGMVGLVLPPEPPKADSDLLLAISSRFVELRLPEGTALLTADPVGELVLSGTIKGPMPPAPLRSALAAWRDAGGTVEVTQFVAAQATLTLSGTATVALDQDLQPIVAASVNARGLGPTIDLLVSQHRLYPEDALKAKLFVKGAERDVPGGTKEVATGFTIQAGWLSWGPFKLAKVPPIQWP